MDWIKNKTLKKDWLTGNPKIWMYLFLGWMGSLTTFLLSLMAGWFFDLYFQQTLSKSELLSRLGVNVSDFRAFFLSMILIASVKFLIQYFERKGINKAADEFVHTLSARLFRSQIRWSSDLFAARPFGKYLLRYSGDMSSIRNMLVNGIHRGLRDGLFLISGVLLMGWINWLWTLVIIGVAILLLPVFYWVDKRQVEPINSRQNAKNELLNHVTTSFANHRRNKEKNQEDRILRGFRRRNRESLQAANSFQTWESLRHALVNGAASILLLSLLGSVYFSGYPTSPGELLTFLLILTAMTPALRNSLKSPNLIQKGLISLRKIERMRRKKEKITSSEPNPLDSTKSLKASNQSGIPPISTNQA